jgi:hypothetical protein
MKLAVGWPGDSAATAHAQSELTGAIVVDNELTEVRVVEDQDGVVTREVPAERLIQASGAREISVPYSGTEYTCPSCEMKIPTRKQRPMSKPAKYAHMLNDVLKCPYCSFVFSYRLRAVVLQG